MGATFIISGLRDKRAAIAGQIVEARRQIDRLQAHLIHIDAVLRLYGLNPGEIPTKGRVSQRSAYFDRNELSRRCRDFLRDNGAASADAIAVQAMQDKGLDPEVERKLRTDFGRRILVTLHDMRKGGQIEKFGHGRGVTWRLAPESKAPPE